jgi:hypothetical protein
MTYEPGDFSWLPDAYSSTRNMLGDAYKAVTLAEKWDEMKIEPPSGFMFSDLPYMDAVDKHITYAHSGATYGMTMRSMQYIARYGWDNFVRKNIVNCKS